MSGHIVRPGNDCRLCTYYAIALSIGFRIRELPLRVFSGFKGVGGAISLRILVILTRSVSVCVGIVLGREIATRSGLLWSFPTRRLIGRAGCSIFRFIHAHNRSPFINIQLKGEVVVPQELYGTERAPYLSLINAPGLQTTIIDADLNLECSEKCLVVRPCE
jgi:hypothetical protein